MRKGPSVLKAGLWVLFSFLNGQKALAASVAPLCGLRSHIYYSAQSVAGTLWSPWSPAPTPQLFRL